MASRRDPPEGRRWASPLLGGGGEGGPASGGRGSLGGRGLLLGDYLEAPLQHPLWVLIPFLLSVGAAAGAAFLLPERFTASCLVLIKASGVPERIMANAAEELDARRSRTIYQEILSRTRLEKVSEELRPYPGRVGSAAVAALEGAIEVKFKGSDAFSIEFSHRDRHIAEKVTNRLATLFIEEFRRARRSQAEGAADFLDQELQTARSLLDAKEEALRRYKEANLGKLPEQMQATLSTLQRLQLELQGVEQSLEAAEARLDRATSRGGGAGTAGGSTPAALSERESLELELLRLRQRYTDQHPDIQALLSRIQSLAKEPTPAPGVDRSAIAAGQLERATSDVKALLARSQDLRDQIAALQRRVDQMPRTEQELALLTRDFHQLRDNYQALLRKRMEAETAERLQQRWTEDFEIIDPARVPEQHSFPNRPLFLLVGSVVGLVLGLGAAVLAEHFNPEVIGPEDLQAATRTDLLAVLPFVETRSAPRVEGHSAVPPVSRRGTAR